ncbi:MAG: hypothetical protein HYY23_18365 [Verrucomicrobia bacterium]|nr:hypothetical protein [Verrucomicrobiota bacterium]
MMTTRDLFQTNAALILVTLLTAAVRSQAADGVLQEGQSVKRGKRTGTLKNLETPPVVESDYTQRFRFDSFENPKLKELELNE